MDFDTYFASLTNQPMADQRRRALEALGGKCSRCGIGDPRVLQIDHVDGGGTAERGTSNRNWPAIYRRVADGASGYDLLCANCNQIKRYELRESGRNYGLAVRTRLAGIDDTGTINRLAQLELGL